MNMREQRAEEVVTQQMRRADRLQAELAAARARIAELEGDNERLRAVVRELDAWHVYFRREGRKTMPMDRIVEILNIAPVTQD